MKRTPTPRARARNQRVSNPRQRKQQHLLDVKVRSHKATQHRNHRILVIVSKVALCLLVLGGLIFGGRYGARRLFFDNPDYRVSKIDVKTDGTLLRDQVLKVAELREGENIFSVNLGRVHDRLQELPQVDDVQVVRNMPAEIDIKITERKPIGWITSENEIVDPFASDAAFLVDARGALMKEKKLLPEYLGLPVIVGCPNEPLAAGQKVSSFEGKAALELLRLSTGSFMQTRFQVRQIDLSKGYCLIVTDKNHARVTFDFDDLDGQLHRLEQFLVYCEDSRRELETVNLMVKRNTPVTFTKIPAEVINETIDPEGEEPKILRATPVHPESKTEMASAKQKSNETKIRRALPVARGKRN